MIVHPKYPIDTKVYISFTSYGLWSGQQCKVIAVREGLQGYLYDLEFNYKGKPTVLKDFEEHKLRSF